MGAPKGLFAQQLNRAAAQRGGLDGVYQDLSDHFTRLLQRLYPVWTVLGPGLSDPAHIEIHSRTVYMDSDRLLGRRDEILAGRLDRWRILVTIGVGVHETLHAKHTKRWVVEFDADCDDDQLVCDRRLLEEPRMEAWGCRDHPPQSIRGRFIRRALSAAVVDVIVPAFVQQVANAALAGQPITRDMCGRAMTYLQARTHYDVVDPGALAALQPIWQRVLGAGDIKALDDLYARAIWIPDGDNDALSRAAQQYRQIIGPPDPPHSSPRGDTGQGAGSGRAEPNAGQRHADDGDGHGQRPSQGSGKSSGQASNKESNAPGGAAAGGSDATHDTAADCCDGGGQAPSAGSLKDALEHALGQARDGQLAQLNEEINLNDLLQHTSTPTANAGKGRGTGAPSGRIPDRGVDRPPFADERAQANRYADRLAKARALGTRQIDKRTPGGRFNPRAYVRGAAQRQRGAPVTSHPWQIVRRQHAPIQEPHVALIIDTSGSMGMYEYALGPIAWIVQDGLRQFGGRCAIALFGNGAELLCDGSKPMRQVPGIKVGGGTAFAADAICLVCEHLEMENRRRPRFVYILSDGGWYDTATGVAKIGWLAEQDVPTIHLSIGIEPLSVQADRVSVLTDPASALDVIAQDTVAALRAANRPPALG